MKESYYKFVPKNKYAIWPPTKKLYKSKDGFLSLGVAGKKDEKTKRVLERLLNPQDGTGIDLKKWIEKRYLTFEEKDFLSEGYFKSNLTSINALVTAREEDGYNLYLMSPNGKLTKAKDQDTNRVFGVVNCKDNLFENVYIGKKPLGARYKPDKIFTMGSGQKIAIDSLCNDTSKNRETITPEKVLENACYAILFTNRFDMYSSGGPDFILDTPDHRVSSIGQMDVLIQEFILEIIEKSIENNFKRENSGKFPFT
jgi:hypothetical protein